MQFSPIASKTKIYTKANVQSNFQHNFDNYYNRKDFQPKFYWNFTAAQSAETAKEARSVDIYEQITVRAVSK